MYSPLYTAGVDRGKKNPLSKSSIDPNKYNQLKKKKRNKKTRNWDTVILYIYFEYLHALLMIIPLMHPWSSHEIFCQVAIRVGNDICKTTYQPPRKFANRVYPKRTQNSMVFNEDRHSELAIVFVFLFQYCNLFSTYVIFIDLSLK